MDDAAAGPESLTVDVEAAPCDRELSEASEMAHFDNDDFSSANFEGT